MKNQFKRVLPYVASLFVIAAATLSSGCTDYSDDIDDLKKKTEANSELLSTLQGTVNSLQSDISSGKLITKVEDISGTPGGIKITFSDNTSKTILNGEKGDKGDKGDKGEAGPVGPAGVAGSTPLVYIDSDGYWCVAATGTKGTSDRVLVDGKPVKAKGDKGEIGTDGPKGETGDKGETGEAGTDGDSFISITTTVNADGYLVLHFVNSDITKNKDVTTSIMSNDKIISCVTEAPLYWDFLINGKVYRFGKNIAIPSTVKVLTTGILAQKNKTVNIVFSVSPSNANFEKIAFNLNGKELATRNSNLPVPQSEAEFTFNEPSFLTVNQIVRLTKDNAATYGIDLTQTAINGGEYVANATIKGEYKDIVFEALNGNQAVGFVPKYDIMVMYNAPFQNTVFDAVEDVIPPVEEPVYSRSVNSVAFVQEVVKVTDKDVVFQPAKTATIFSHQDYTNKIAPTEAFLAMHDISYIMLNHMMTISASYTNAAGATQSTVSSDALIAMLTRAEAAPADADKATVLTNMTYAINIDDTNWTNIAVGDMITYKIQMQYTDIAGNVVTSKDVFTLNIIKSANKFSINPEAFLIPTDKHDVRTFTATQIATQLSTKLGMTNATAANVSMDFAKHPITIMKKGETGIYAAITSGVDFDAIKVTALDSNTDFSIVANKTINAGDYRVVVPIIAPATDNSGETVVTMEVNFTVQNPTYTVNLNSGKSLDTDHVYNVPMTTNPDLKVNVSEVIDINSLKTTDSHAYQLAEGTFDGIRGLIATPKEVVGMGHWDEAQAIQLYVKLETQQIIPITILNSNASTTGITDGKFAVKFTANNLVSATWNVDSNDLASNAPSFNYKNMNAWDMEVFVDDPLAARNDINTMALKQVNFVNGFIKETNATMNRDDKSTYENAKKDGRITVKYELAGIDKNNVDVQLPDGLTEATLNLITINGQSNVVTLAADSAMRAKFTAWIGTIHQKITVTITDNFGVTAPIVKTIKIGITNEN